MAMNHKATPEQWASVKQAYEPIEMRPGVFLGTKDTTIAACLLELRARVEALEAAANSSLEAAANSSLEAAANSSAGLTGPTPAGSLVERVSKAICKAEDCDDMPDLWGPEARAAIREVAAAARDAGLTAAAKWLEQQADR